MNAELVSRTIDVLTDHDDPQMHLLAEWLKAELGRSPEQPLPVPAPLDDRRTQDLQDKLRILEEQRKLMTAWLEAVQHEVGAERFDTVLGEVRMLKAERDSHSRILKAIQVPLGTTGYDAIPAEVGKIMALLSEYKKKLDRLQKILDECAAAAGCKVDELPGWIRGHSELPKAPSTTSPVNPPEVSAAAPAKFPEAGVAKKPDEPDKPCVMIDRPPVQAGGEVKETWLRAQIGGIAFQGGAWRPSTEQLCKYIVLKSENAPFAELMREVGVNSSGIGVLKQQERLAHIYGGLVRPEAKAAMLRILREIYIHPRPLKGAA